MVTHVISAKDLKNLLPFDECVEAMEEAMLATHLGTISIPPRSITPLIDGSAFLGLMPGSSSDIATYGVKVVNLHPNNRNTPTPVIQGFVTLFDHEDGRILALVEGAEITRIRTAASTALATRLLARPGSRTCGILGTGAQASAHIHALRSVLPIEEYRVWGRDENKAKSFASHMASETGYAISAVKSAEEAAASDVVCCVTSSPEPILKGAWISPGTHVNLVGAHSLSTREADTDLVVKAQLYVDSMESCRNEGGDFMIPIKEGAIEESAIEGELGGILNGTVSGRQSDSAITVFNSLGIVAQDLYAGRHAYMKALSDKRIQTVEL